MSMPKEEIIGMVLEMYDARKEAKEYLEFYANPDEDGKLEEYKKIITEEFYPSRGRMQILTRMVSWKSIRRLLQKSSIHRGEDRNQRPDSRFVGKLFLITRN